MLQDVRRHGDGRRRPRSELAPNDAVRNRLAARDDEIQAELFVDFALHHASADMILKFDDETVQHVDPEALMQAVNLHLSRTVPAPMEPLLAVIPIA